MKQKILVTYVESGFGHISSMDSIYEMLVEKYGDVYDIQKSFILTEDGYKNLSKMNDFLIKEVQNTNKIPYFGRFVFPFIHLLGGHKLLRFFHRQMAYKSFRQGLEAIKKRSPDIIITNHYFTDLLAVEYKRRINHDAVVINYNPDPTLHSFWDSRDGIKRSVIGSTRCGCGASRRACAGASNAIRARATNCAKNWDCRTTSSPS